MSDHSAENRAFQADMIASSRNYLGAIHTIAIKCVIVCVEAMQH